MRKKAEVLEAMAGHLTQENSAIAAGVSRRLVYKWRQEDPEFAQACRDAQESALDKLVEKTFEVGLNKDNRYFEKDALLNRFFLIKGFRPEFKDSYRPEVAVNEVHFTFQIPLPAGMRKELPGHSDVIEGEVVSTD